MSILVTGAAGQLGRELMGLLGDQAVPLDLPDHDLTDHDATRKLVLKLRPSAVVNCAAYVRVDDAEEEPSTCFRINSHAVKNLVEACRGVDARLVQISTDYVFGGVASREHPFLETDSPTPKGAYARSKYEAELHVAQLPWHTIVRSCGLYARRDTPSASGNFLQTILRFAKSRRPLRVVNDQHCTPTYVPHLARAICHLLLTDTDGTFHVTSGGATTWFEFAREAIRVAGLNVDISPITTADYNARAPRPAYSVLDTRKYHTTGGPVMPHWRDALVEYFA